MLYFLCLAVEAGGEGGIWYTMVLMLTDNGRRGRPLRLSVCKKRTTRYAGEAEKVLLMGRK